MKSGKLVRHFFAKDRREVILRTPRWEDLHDFLDLINSLVEERVEKDELFFVVAEVDGKVVATSEIDRRTGYEEHVGVIGIAIKSGFRDMGIGTEMMETLIKHAEKMGLKVLTLTAFASNRRAIHVYEKIGFVQTGRVPKKHFKDGKYIDEIIMTKLLE
jgi:RimJ/RimL family protein N-acetyltransferase